jgi:hypothetical protein
MDLSVVVISAGVEQWDKLTVPAIRSLKQRAKEDFELIVMDNGGLDRGDVNTDDMIPYADAVNMAAQWIRGKRLLILNNDIIATGDWQRWLYTHPYCGPKILRIEGVDYVEGWCISIERDLWHLLGGFNTVYKNSWEDVDLAWRLNRLGIPTKRITVPMSHIWGATRNAFQGSNRWDAANHGYFKDRKKEKRHQWRKV